LINDNDNQDEIPIPLERNNSLGINQPMSEVVITSQSSSIDIDSLKPIQEGNF
jgi:hypothetical protein